MNTRVAIKSLLTRISLIFIFVSALAAGAFGQAVLVSDAHTSATSVNGNFGTNPALTVSGNNTGYARFNISHLLPAGTKADDVAKASVKFYVSKVATAGKLDVYPILGDWDEKTITFNNAPPIGPLAQTTQQINRDAQGNYVLIDVTDLVKQWLGDGTGQNALPNYGFALLPHPVEAGSQQLADINFDSKENSQTSHDGMLSIQLESGPTGLQTVAHDATLDGDGTASNPLGVAPGAITSTYLANSAVTTGKVADSAIGTTKLSDASVTAAKIADNAVGTTKLSDASVTAAKIAAPLSLTSNSPLFTFSVANSGGGAALTADGSINTSTQYLITGSRVLGGSFLGNLYVGFAAGALNAGTSNVFIGQNTGAKNTGSQNTFAGAFAGRENTTGWANSFFGDNSGGKNTTGTGGSFFGDGSGQSNTTGNANTFIGGAAGQFNTAGSSNTFIGQVAGQINTSGSRNTYLGMSVGLTADPASNANTLIGYSASSGAGVNNSTAIGAGALVTQSNSIVLGAVGGINPFGPTNVGIGTTAPKTRLHVATGELYIEASGQGMILKSPNGLCFKLTVSDAGALTITGTPCP
jgi:hypothetical protein